MAVRTSFKHLLGWFTVAPECELDNQYWAQCPPRKQLPWEADAKVCWRRHHKEGSLLTAFWVTYWETKKFQFRKITFYTLSFLSLETLEFLSGASNLVWGLLKQGHLAPPLLAPTLPPQVTEGLCSWCCITPTHQEPVTHPPLATGQLTVPATKTASVAITLGT